MTVPEDQGKSLQGWRRVWKTCPGRIHICFVLFLFHWLFSFSRLSPLFSFSFFCLIMHVSLPFAFSYFCLSPPLSLLEIAAFYLVLIFWALCEVLFMYPLIILDELNISISILHGRKLRHRCSNFSKLSRYSQGFELHLTNPQTDFPEQLQSLFPPFPSLPCLFPLFNPSLSPSLPPFSLTFATSWSLHVCWWPWRCWTLCTCPEGSETIQILI